MSIKSIGIRCIVGLITSLLDFVVIIAMVYCFDDKSDYNPRLPFILMVMLMMLVNTIGLCLIRGEKSGEKG